MARRHQQTRVEYDGTKYQITVDSDHVTVKMIEWKEQDGRSIQLFGNVSKKERAAVLLDNPHLSSAKSYRRAYSHAKRRERYA
jgi:adenine-specific DNA methylase